MTYGPAGNNYDKFSSMNPISRYLMRGFIGSLKELIAQTEGGTVLEVGCGEGYIQEILSTSGFSSLLAFDIDMPIVVDARRRHPSSNYFVANGEQIPVPTKSCDLAMAIEVLEHVPDPDKVLAEMKRVARKYVIVSVPREPIWRVLNLARGKYISSVGNTPGHIQHWSAGGFERTVARHFKIVSVLQPLPWTMILAKIDG
jgi:ubiquinone/menaquinone biosynthesis C-methylase UbiE